MLRRILKLNRIKKELKQVSEKYGRDRKSEIIYDTDTEEEFVEEIPDYEANLFFTRDGYFKKITPLSLRMGGEQKLKEGDEMVCAINSKNSAELLFFTDKCQVYKAKASDFEDSKASVLGDFVASKLEYDEGESSLYMVHTRDYSGFMIFVFDNGRIAKVPLKSYETKTNRKKLIKAYCEKYKITNWTSDDVLEWIVGAPTVEAEPVRHGKWTTKDVGFLQTRFVCSACGGCFAGCAGADYLQSLYGH